MQIFNIGVNPLIQQLERNLHGITLYSLPVCGPVSEYEVNLPPMKKNTSIIGYVDDLNPVITRKEEFEILFLFVTIRKSKWVSIPSRPFVPKVQNNASWKVERMVDSRCSSSSVSISV